MRVLILLVSWMAVVACASTPNLTTDRPSAAENQPYISTASDSDFDVTLARLQAAILSRGFQIVATVDHAAGASSAGLVLAPSTLVIFGSPVGGTPLIQADPSFGLDLPLRALVYVSDIGSVFVLTPDVAALADARGLNPSDGAVQRASAALAAIRKETSVAP